jgi:hypothetical protein
MSVATATHAGRRAALKTMTDWCIVRRPVSVPVGSEDASAPAMDPVTGKYNLDDDVDDVEMTVIYEGPFRIQVRADINANAYEAVIGEREDLVRTANVEFPVKTPASARGMVVRGSTAAIRDDDILTIKRCRLDPAMNGRVVNLQADIKGKSQATKRRFRSRELIG